ncbi:unnamed protein product, partial [Allacma fusca]
MDIELAEFTMWLDCLNQSIEIVASFINSSSINTESLLFAFEQMSVDLKEVENCRSSQSKNSPHDFTCALPSIIKAKHLVPTVKRLLANVRHSITETENLTTIRFENDHSSPISLQSDQQSAETTEVASTAVLSTQSTISEPFDEISQQAEFTSESVFVNTESSIELMSLVQHHHAESESIGKIQLFITSVIAKTNHQPNVIENPAPESLK